VAISPFGAESLPNSLLARALGWQFEKEIDKIFLEIMRAKFH